ncbi:MAG: Asp-tRNA(Asn)/Glu-tRNA(Gln) amidotransferase subunit GatC [Deltaproteobacteria bacterium]|nr:Asp-tRNA(Asn)/Glu-tRNA(Gln) amidotransferase subunit GatC [Deltaproteobacteria bacterium]
MKISPEKVQGIASLARLEITPEQAPILAAQMGDILGYMDTLNELDTSNVEPMYTPVAHVSVLRPDETSKEFPREDILRNAPENNGEYFVVPRIV